LHFGGMRRQDRLHVHSRQTPGHLGPREAARDRFVEKSWQRRGQGRTPFTPRRAMPPDVVPVFGDVGEQREITEGADHGDRLGRRQPIEECRQPLARLDVLEAPARHRELPDRLDAVESRRPLVGPQRVAEDAPEEADVLAELGVLGGGGVRR
jgi:hypothetical protein